MLRFIDLGKQIGLDEEWPQEFAFYNTVTDRFLAYNNNQVWSHWNSFIVDYNAETVCPKYAIDRIRGLCPDWVFE